MFFYLSDWLLKRSAGTAWADQLSALRLFKYITFRCAGAAVTALVLSWWLGPKVILWLKQLKFGQDYADKAEAGGNLAASQLIAALSANSSDTLETLEKDFKATQGRVRSSLDLLPRNASIATQLPPFT